MRRRDTETRGRGDTGKSKIQNPKSKIPFILHPSSFILSLCLCVFVVQSVSAAPVMAGTELRTLPNGLRLIVREQHGAALVAVDVWVRAGSGREEPQESGAAHFLEHLLFKGTPTRKPGEIDAAIEDLGAMLNAGTTRDGAHLFTTVAAPYLDTALDVLADALQHATLDAREVERERAVILDEVARSRNDLRRQATDRLYALLHAGDPYGRSVLGEYESLRGLSRQTIASFYRRLYTPDNATVVLVGDITSDAAQAEVMKAFGNWKKEDSPTPNDNQSKIQNPESEILFSPSSTALALGALVNAGDNAREACAADIIAVLLDDPAGGRLTSGIGAQGLATDITADYVTLRGPGVFTLYAATEPAHLESVRSAFAAQWERLRQEPVPPGELEFAKRRVIGSYLAEIETYAGQARMLGFYDVVGDYRFALDYVDTIRKITAQDVQAFAKRYFDPALRKEVVLQPQEKK
jgi:zinc protease